MTVTARCVRARWVSENVLALARAGGATGEVTARFGSTFHVQFGDFVAALVPPGAPRMPNGISAGAALAGADGPAVGERAALGSSILEAGGCAIEWDAEQPPTWDARVMPWSSEDRSRLRARACAILATPPDRASPELAANALARVGGFAGRDPAALAAVDALVFAVRSGDPGDAARAGRELCGRGPGLTPLGDDVLAAAALTVASAGAAGGAAPERRRAWVAALVPSDLHARTTSVSATLLALAARGHAIGPARELLRPGPLSASRLRGALAGLRRLGHTTGAAYVVAIGAVALLLASDDNRTTERRPDEG